MSPKLEEGDLLTGTVATELLGISAAQIAVFEKRGVLNFRTDAEGIKHYSLAALKSLQSPPTVFQPVPELKAAKGRVRVAELFCGAGGLALGLERAGMNTIFATDWDKDCIDTIRRNRPGWGAQQADVTTLNLSDLRGNTEVLTGGFPCQAFSYAGKQLGFGDTRGTLFYDYLRLINQIRPRLIIAENVKGLLSHDGGRTLETMLSELRAAGYKVAFRVLRSQFLNVPQKRERLVMMGVESSFGSKMYFPKELLAVTNLGSALVQVPDSPGAEYPNEKARVMSLVPEGGNWKDLPEDEQRRYMKGSFHLGGGKTGLARRLSRLEPSLTLTTAPAQNQTERCHPTETRPLTIREYARIQTFPDSWEFSGSLNSQYRQIGNAVPVNLGFHIGIAARVTLGEKPEEMNGHTLLELVTGT